MRRFGPVLAVALLTGVGFAGPALAQTPSPSPTARTVTVTRADDNGFVWLRQGDRLVVSLSQPARGVWRDIRVTLARNGPGLFREAATVTNSGAGATFLATSNRDQWIWTTNDDACLHADPRCDFDRERWQLRVVVADTEPTPPPAPQETPPTRFIRTGGPIPPATGRVVTITPDSDDVLHLQVGDRVVIDVPGHFTTPETYGDGGGGIFRESLDIGIDHTRATFFAVSETVAPVTFYSDAACFYSEPRCLMAQMRRSVSVIVGCARPFTNSNGATVADAAGASLKVEPRVLVAGSTTTVSGGAASIWGPNPNETVAILVRRATEPVCSLLTVTRTDADGRYVLRQAPLVNRSYRALLPFSPYNYIPQADVAVRTALTRIAPANGAVVPRGTPLAVRGVARPGYAGGSVHLQERTGTSSRQLVASTTMGADGGFTLSLVLPPGRHVLQIVTRETDRNAPGAAPEFAITVS